MITTIAHIIGILGIIVTILAFQCKKYQNILWYKSANEFLFAIQLFLLQAYTGVAMNTIGIVRNILFAKRAEKGKSNTVFMGIFSVLFVIFGVLTWQGYKSIIIIVSKIISTLAYGNKNTTLIRILIFFSSIGWVIYNICVHSPEGIINESLTITSIIVAMVRFDIIERFKKNGKK